MARVLRRRFAPHPIWRAVLSLFVALSAACYESHVPGDGGSAHDANRGLDAFTERRDGGHDASATLDAFVLERDAFSDGLDAARPRPYIVSVTPPSDADYLTTTTFDFAVRFNVPVVVTYTPALVLRLGGWDEFAPYVSGSGTAELVFRYMVLAGDDDDDGIEVQSPVTLTRYLSSGDNTIADAFGTDALLDFTPIDRTGVRVNARLACPRGFIGVLANPIYGAEDFCFSAFEMANVGGVPEAVPKMDAWLVANPDEAEAICATLGFGYHAATNAEWQTVARDVEGVSQNWSGAAVGVGVLAIGNADVAVGPPSGDNNYPCGTPGFVSRFSSCDVYASPDLIGRRTHFLRTAAVAWDLGGNHTEWVRGSHPEVSRGFICALSGADKVAFGPSGDFEVGCPSELAADATFENTHGLGFEEGAGGSRILRGGAGGRPISPTQSVFYANTNPFWNVDHGPSGAFRCVYHPPAVSGTRLLLLLPALAGLAPGATQAFTVDGGTPPHVLSLVATSHFGSGTFDPTSGVYTAGPSDGLDVLQVFDPATGETAYARVTTAPY